MTKIEWSEDARSDILQIYRHISLDSPSNADSFLDRLIDSAEMQLSVSPLIGRKIPEINDPDFREIIYGQYRIMYHFERDIVTITHVRHGARQFF